MASLEEQFAGIVANVLHNDDTRRINILPINVVTQPTSARTFYSIGEAISYRGFNAKLGASANRDSSSRR